MKYLILGAIIIVTISLMGCSSTTESSALASTKSSDSNNKSRTWCQKNALSASVSMRDKQVNAKRCDVRASQAYKEAKEREYNKDIEQ